MTGLVSSWWRLSLSAGVACGLLAPLLGTVLLLLPSTRTSGASLEVVRGYLYAVAMTLPIAIVAAGPVAFVLGAAGSMLLRAAAVSGGAPGWLTPAALLLGSLAGALLIQLQPGDPGDRILVRLFSYPSVVAMLTGACCGLVVSRLVSRTLSGQD